MSVEERVRQMSVRIAEETPVSQPPADASVRVSQNSAVRTLVTLSALAAVYALLLALEPHRRLWFDELITYFVAKAPTWSRMFELARRFDLNPLPMDYVLTRISVNLFGDGAMAVRGPSILAFYIASVTLYFFVRRKAGDGFAAFGVLMFWYSPVFYYATEARPYAFLCMFFGLLLLFWDIASAEQRPAAAVWGVALANLGLMTVHAFAPLSLLPFFVAEALRYRSRRKPDYFLWAALALPALLVVAYLPSARSHTSALFPMKFQAGIRKIPIFFLHVFLDMGSGMFAALFAAIVAPMAVRRLRSGNAEDPPQRHWTTDAAMIAVLIFNPVLLNLVLVPLRGPFFDRYCITTMMAMYIALVICVARRLHFNQLAGVCATAALACVLVTEQVIMPWMHKAGDRNGEILAGVEPQLPLVAASGLTFLEMDHYEGTGLRSRLYYLKDRSAALEYSHATLFEDFLPLDQLAKYFPIGGNVQPYSSFTQRYRKFLVLGTVDYPEDWLLRKLAADGATLVPIGYYVLPYKDHTLYRITLPVETTKMR
jgi:hypothetical protein